MNMKFAAASVLGLLSLAALAPTAAAADNGFYLGAGITETQFDVEGLGSGSLDDNSFKVIAGFRPLNWLAFEANYLDLGGEEADGNSLDSSAITLSGLVLAEIGIVDLYARLGVAKWDVDVASDFLEVSESDDGWEPTYGVGIGAHFGSIGLRAEYEAFSMDDYDMDVDTISLSFTYTFL